MITDEEATGAQIAMRFCRFFPSEDFQRAQVSALLIRMVRTKDQLDWLVDEQTQREWKGAWELRSLFCSKFRPLDGIEAESEAQGVTSADLEYKYALGQQEEYERNKIEWQREQRLIGEAPAEPVDVTVAIKPVDPKERYARAAGNRQRLASTLNERDSQSTEPIYIPATRKRTPEENAAIVRELEAQLAGGAK